MREYFLACPTCLCFDDDLPPDTKPGDLCPCCGEAAVVRLARRDFMKAIARKIVLDLL